MAAALCLRLQLLLAFVSLARAFVVPGHLRATVIGFTSRTGLASRPGCAPPPAMAEATEVEIISFSDKAMQQLISLREKQGVDEIRLRMGVRAGGCSGMSYVMDFMKEDESEDATDTVIEYGDGIRCVIDAKSLMFLFGLRLDYSDELIGGGFSFQNPNAEDTCGCGKSFGV